MKIPVRSTLSLGVAVLAAAALLPAAAPAQVRSLTISGEKAGPGGVPAGSVRVVQKGLDLEANQLELIVYEWGVRRVGSRFSIGCANFAVCTDTFALADFTGPGTAGTTRMRLKRNTLYVVQAWATGGGLGTYRTYPVFNAFWTR